MHPGFLDEILSYEQWRKRTQTSQPSLSQYLLRTLQDVPQPKYCHNPQNEKMPAHVFFTLNTADMDTRMTHIFAELLTSLGGQSYEEIEEIGALMEKSAHLKPGPEKLEWSYALVGKQGEGKSTVNNCLLDRYNLAGVSKGTKSCTQFATEFRHKAGASDETKNSDVTIAFFDNKQLKANMEENIKRYSRFHHLTDEYEQSEGDVEKSATKLEENLSKEAYGVFCAIVRGDEQAETVLHDLLASLENIKNGTLLEFLLRQQHERLQALGVGDDNTVTYTDVPDQLSPENERLGISIATVRNMADALAPLVNMVTIRTGGRLLRYGLVLLDIPGYGDLNQARIASANVHRRSAHGEIIVGAAPRIEDNEDIDGHIFRSRKAHGDKNTILVMNQIDKAYELPSPHTVFREIEENQESPFKDLLSASRKNLNADEAYFIHFSEVGSSAMIRKRAEMTAAQLKQQHGGQINVFSIVASAAHDWLNEFRADDPNWGPYMSGIPYLKQYLLGLTAERQMQIYENHYFDTLPSVVDDNLRIVTKTTGKTDVLAPTRKALEQCFQNAMQASRSAKDINKLSAVKPIFQGAEKDDVSRRVKALIAVWSNSTVIMWQTFFHTLLCKGIPISYASRAYKDRDINWNRDLLETMEMPDGKSHAYTSPETHLSNWMTEMKGNSATISNSVTEPISTISDLVEEIITASSIPLVLKRRTRSAWKNIDNNIRDMVNRFQEQVVAAIDKIYLEVTTEEDIGCMIAEMNVDTYLDAENQRRGQFVYTRQRESLTKGLCELDSSGEAFVDRYEAASMRKMSERIAQVSEKFITDVEDKLSEFIRITEQFIETDIYNTPQHAAARNILQSWLPEFESLLSECQSRFPGQEFQQDDLLMGGVKRRLSSVRSKAVEKKIKIEAEERDLDTAGQPSTHKSVSKKSAASMPG